MASNAILDVEGVSPEDWPEVEVSYSAMEQRAVIAMLPFAKDRSVEDLAILARSALLAALELTDEDIAAMNFELSFTRSAAKDVVKMMRVKIATRPTHGGEK